MSDSNSTTPPNDALLNDYFHKINALPLVEAAVMYANMGLQVFPLQPFSKLPVQGWLWSRMHSSDEATVRQWWAMYPEANIGLVCGERSGVNILDIDTKAGHDGMRSYQAIVQDAYTGPCQQTPTGGQHLWFRYQPGYKNFTHKGELGGLDMRTDNGYVVASPSRTDQGLYRWLQGATVPEMPTALQGACEQWSTASNTETVDAPDVPEDLVDWHDLGGLDSPYTRYLEQGDTSAWSYDESRAIFATAGALMRQVNDAGQVFGILSDNAHAYACAERHRTHGNPADWLWKYGIGKMVTAAARQNPEEVFSPIRQEPTARPATFSATDPTLGAALPPRPFLYGHRILRGYVSMLVAPGGVGKSSVLISDGLAMATGRPLLYEKPIAPLRVCYLCNEDDLDELRRRTLATLMQHDLMPGDIAGAFDLQTGYGRPSKVYIEGQDNTALLHQWIEFARHYDVLMLDPLISLHQGVEENSNEGMEKVMSALRHIASEADVGVQVVAHTGKIGPNSEAHAGSSEASRGASAMRDAARITYTLARMDQATAEKEFIDWELHGRHLRRLDSGKLNFSPAIAQAHWLKFYEVDLNNSDGLHPSDKVGVPVPINIEEVKDMQAAQRADTSQLAATAAVAKTLLATELAPGHRVSVRSFAEAHAGQYGPFGVGRTSLAQLLTAAIEAGMLASESAMERGQLCRYLVNEASAGAEHESLF